MQAAIEARAVSHRTRAGEVAVRDVSLTIGHGELMAIIGGRGSGKTTPDPLTAFASQVPSIPAVHMAAPFVAVIV